MSLDYPNRQDWLAVRETKHVARGHFIHVSGIGRAARRLLPPAQALITPAGRTYNVGRNQAKRAAQ